VRERCKAVYLVSADFVDDRLTDAARQDLEELRRGGDQTERTCTDGECLARAKGSRGEPQLTKSVERLCQKYSSLAVRSEQFALGRVRTGRGLKDA